MRGSARPRDPRPGQKRPYRRRRQATPPGLVELVRLLRAGARAYWRGGLYEPPELAPPSMGGFYLYATPKGFEEDWASFKDAGGRVRISGAYFDRGVLVGRWVEPWELAQRKKIARARCAEAAEGLKWAICKV